MWEKSDLFCRALILYNIGCRISVDTLFLSGSIIPVVDLLSPIDFKKLVAKDSTWNPKDNQFEMDGNVISNQPFPIRKVLSSSHWLPTIYTCTRYPLDIHLQILVGWWNKSWLMQNWGVSQFPSLEKWSFIKYQGHDCFSFPKSQPKSPDLKIRQLSCYRWTWGRCKDKSNSWRKLYHGWIKRMSLRNMPGALSTICVEICVEFSWWELVGNCRDVDVVLVVVKTSWTCRSATGRLIGWLVFRWSIEVQLLHQRMGVWHHKS